MSRPRDAIIGARYMDTVFDSEFTIVAVRAETDDGVADEDDIIVVMDYDTFDGTSEVPLSVFRDEAGIEVIDIPEHAG